MLSQEAAQAKGVSWTEEVESKMDIPMVDNL
jgi:hypothetical protein